MKKLLLISSFLFGVLRAQNFTPDVISSGGNSIIKSGYSLSYTIGEMTLVKTVVSPSGMLTQGFEQPDWKKTAQIAGFSGIDGAVALFPNPANDFVHLQYELPVSGEMQMAVYNSLGQQVSANYTDRYNAGKKTFTIYTADLAAGVYYVNALFTAANGRQYAFNKKLEVIR